MLRIWVSLIFVLSLPAISAAQNSEADILKAEYKRLYEYVLNLEPDGQIGGFMNYKKFNGYEILWALAESETDSSVIRLYNEHHDGTEDFAVSYYHSNQIVRGTWVLRRFIGPVLGGGWRNDTIDLKDDSYLGSQGLQTPVILDSDQSLLSDWDVQLIQ